MTAMLDAKGWKATYKTELGQHTKPLLFWVLEDGNAVGYVLSSRDARPIPADSATNFDGYVQDEEVDAVTVPAEPGWWIVDRARNAPSRGYWSKILAWRIFGDGFGVKAIGEPDADGSSYPREATEDKVMFVFDPDRVPVSSGPWPVIEDRVAA